MIQEVEQRSRDLTQRVLYPRERAQKEPSPREILSILSGFFSNNRPLLLTLMYKFSNHSRAKTLSTSHFASVSIRHHQARVASQKHAKYYSCQAL